VTNNTNNFVYVETPVLSKDSINLLLSSENEKAICQAIISACKFIGDYEFVLDILRRYGFIQSRNVQLNILSGLGLVTYNHEKIDKDLALSILKFALSTDDELINSFAVEIKEEIEHYAQLYGFPIWKDEDFN
jgi:hypothetical protein